MLIARAQSNLNGYENEICWFKVFFIDDFLNAYCAQQFRGKKFIDLHICLCTLVRLHHFNRCNIRFVEVRSKHSYFLCALAFN